MTKKEIIECARKADACERSIFYIEKHLADDLSNFFSLAQEHLFWYHWGLCHIKGFPIDKELIAQCVARWPEEAITDYPELLTPEQMLWCAEAIFG